MLLSFRRMAHSALWAIFLWGGTMHKTEHCWSRPLAEIVAEADRIIAESAPWQPESTAELVARLAMLAGDAQIAGKLDVCIVIMGVQNDVVMDGDTVAESITAMLNRAYAGRSWRHVVYKHYKEHRQRAMW